MITILYIYVIQTNNMKKNIIYIIVIQLLLISCGPSLFLIQSQNRTKLNQISLGLTKREVLDIMGTTTNKVSNGQNWIYLTSPYKTETMIENGRNYEILFFYSDTKKQDGVISDDELTPIVLLDNKVVGFGWSFMKDNIKKYQIDIR